ncbi:alginate lyase family protein [Paenibacillus sp. MDMC362]|uniref:alginate lyase family protein n=1 Tax=Paenibacillus sp. MDMC362 TaxID=2977365 RepID=UPI000DC2408D|nr:alginate lyase family protein [Paenibacillus sp. MDMC362]RAR42394.1 hypothetical protein DP091_18495 [Paenibacillus sp. MDMC362]
MTLNHNSNLFVGFANRLLNNDLVVNEKINIEVYYDIDNINWDINASVSPNTFLLYLHSLRPVLFLTKAYLEKKDINYLNAALKFIFSWREYSVSETNHNRYTWYDHSVAERTENLIFFLEVYQNLENVKERYESILSIIKTNAEWLFDDNNYTRRHNHGIFEDFSLIKSGYFLNDDGYIQKGITRLDEQLKYAFPNKYIHIENSVGYHIGITAYIKEIYKYLKSVSNEYAKTAYDYFSGAVEFLVYVYKPNLALPLLGDTIGSRESGKIEENYLNRQLEYVQSKGLQGEVPENNIKVYSNDGYFIFREYWDSTDFDQSTWMLFKAGYLSSTHKHADDLSFLLYSKGHDIFIDPGMYNYMIGDKIHEYTNSNFAHNTLIVDGKTYSVSKFNSNKVGLYSYNKKNGYHSIVAFNNIFNGVQIDRTVNIIDGDNFIIIDDILSRDYHKYTQVFHLSNDVEIMDLSKDYALLNIKKTKYCVLLEQLNSSDSVAYIEGNKNNEQFSLMSIGLNQVVPTTTIVFNKLDYNTRFVTSIRILEKRNLYKNNVLYSNNKVLINGVSIEISSRERLPENEVVVEIYGNKAKLINKANSDNQKLSYSFYLLNEITGRKYDSRPYSFLNHAEFKLDKNCSYAIMSYLKNTARETVVKLVGFIRYVGEEFLFEKLDKNQQQPIVEEANIISQGNNLFKFEVSISNFNVLTSKWYIYKNGASHQYIGNNSNFLEYQFTEPGIYSVLYRMNDIYFGEVVFDNFEEIRID